MHHMEWRFHVSFLSLYFLTLYFLLHPIATENTLCRQTCHVPTNPPPNPVAEPGCSCSSYCSHTRMDTVLPSSICCTPRWGGAICFAPWRSSLSTPAPALSRLHVTHASKCGKSTLSWKCQIIHNVWRQRSMDVLRLNRVEKLVLLLQVHM